MLKFPLIAADESVDGRIISALRNAGYTIYSIATECTGMSGLEVIDIAINKQAFIISEDKDFGDELVCKRVSQQVGSLLLRLYDVLIEVRIDLIVSVIASKGTLLQTSFSVLSSKKLRIRKYVE